MFMFEKNGEVYYDGQRLTNIFLQYRLKGFSVDNQKYLVSYTLKDGETPETIMTKLFNSPDMDWVLLLINKRLNSYDEWPLTYEALNAYMDDKYGATHLDDIHHYIDEDGFIVNANPPYTKAISNRDYEYDVNDAKRYIKLPTNDFMNNFVELLDDINY